MIATAKSAIGIDISDAHIEVVQLSGGRKPTVLGAGRVTLPEGVIKGGAIADGTAFIEALKTAARDAKPQAIDLSEGVIVALPEEQVFLRAFQMETATRASGLQKYLEKAVTTVIPLPEEDVLFAHTQMSRSKDISDVVVAATSKQLATDWEDLFRDAGIPLRGFDLEVLATYRDVYAAPPKQTMAIVDIGATTTTVTFFDTTGVRSSHVIYTAGNALTAALAKSTRSKIETAEEKKVTVGLGVKAKAGKNALEKVLLQIATEIQKSIAGFERNHDEPVHELVFVGGGSLMPGAIEWFEAKFSTLVVSLGKGTLLPAKDSYLFLEAVGIALRGVDRRFTKDISLPKPSMLGQKKRRFGKLFGAKGKKKKTTSAKKDLKQKKNNEKVVVKNADNPSTDDADSPDPKDVAAPAKDDVATPLEADQPLETTDESSNADLSTEPTSDETLPEIELPADSADPLEGSNSQKSTPRSLRAELEARNATQSLSIGATKQDKPKRKGLFHRMSGKKKSSDPIAAAQSDAGTSSIADLKDATARDADDVVVHAGSADNAKPRKKRKKPATRLQVWVWFFIMLISAAIMVMTIYMAITSRGTVPALGAKILGQVESIQQRSPVTPPLETAAENIPKVSEETMSEGATEAEPSAPMSTPEETVTTTSQDDTSEKASETQEIDLSTLAPVTSTASLDSTGKQVYIKQNGEGGIPVYFQPTEDSSSTAKVTAGTEHPLINTSEDGLWYQIRISDILDAWVSAQHAEVL